MHEGNEFSTIIEAIYPRFKDKAQICLLDRKVHKSYPQLEDNFSINNVQNHLIEYKQT